jgi:diguanylate cyclase (GGDEF)-like protein
LSKSIPIIVQTSIKDEKTALTAIRSGAMDYLVKSEINPDVILKSIKFSMERFMLFNRINHISRTDELTGLNNRRGFFEFALKQCQYAERNNLNMHIIFVDIDNFKLLNDSYGHDAGDFVLIETSRLLKGVLRERDVLARFGGDEFIALAITGKNEVLEMTVLPRIKNQLEIYNRSGNPYQISLSYGVSKINDFNKDSLKSALKVADSRMYENKKRKKHSMVH